MERKEFLERVAAECERRTKEPTPTDIMDATLRVAADSLFYTTACAERSGLGCDCAAENRKALLALLTPTPSPTEEK